MEEMECCPACGREITEENSLIYDQCPYALEFSSPGDEVSEEWMCDKCYTDRVGDI